MAIIAFVIDRNRIILLFVFETNAISVSDFESQRFFYTPCYVHKLFPDKIATHKHLRTRITKFL